MANKRITTQDLAQEIKVIKENHLTHIHDCIHRIEEEVKDQRKYFTNRLDRLDNRIWWVLGMTVTTLVSVMLAVFGGAL
jgi:hypothetical protein